MQQRPAMETQRNSGSKIQPLTPGSKEHKSRYLRRVAVRRAKPMSLQARTATGASTSALLSNSKFPMGRMRKEHSWKKLLPLYAAQCRQVAEDKPVRT